MPLWAIKMLGVDRLLGYAVLFLEVAIKKLFERLEIETQDNIPLSTQVSIKIVEQNAKHPEASGKEKLANVTQEMVVGIGAHLIEVRSDVAKAGASAVKAGFFALTTAVFLRDSLSNEAKRG